MDPCVTLDVNKYSNNCNDTSKNKCAIRIEICASQYILEQKRE